MAKKIKEKHENIVLTDDDPKRLKKEAGHAKSPKASKAPKTQSREPVTTVDATEISLIKEQLLRVRADFENFKRRTQEERADLFDSAKAELALGILPVIDNLDRAAKHVPDEVSKSDWYQGFTSIKKQFDTLLADMGIARIASVGEPFDPNRHEAVAHEPSTDYDKDVVSEEFEAGYSLGDSVIRPAKVKVSSGKPAEKEKS